MAIIRRRTLTRIFFVICLGFVVRVLFSSPPSSEAPEIRKHGVMDLVSRSDKVLDVQRHDFLQVRMGRDERDDLLDREIRNGVQDYWERFQKP